MERQLLRSILVVAALATAGPATAFFRQDSEGFRSMADDAVHFGVTSMIPDLGSRVLGNGVSNGVDTFYFPCRRNQGPDEVVTLRAGDGPHGLQVAGRQPIPGSLDGSILLWDKGELLVVPIGRIVSMAANDVPTTPTVQLTSTSNVKAGHYDSDSGQLLLLSAGRLESYQRDAGSFRLIGALQQEANYFVFDKATATICLFDDTYLRMYQWPPGAPSPITGPTVSLRVGGAASVGPASVAVWYNGLSRLALGPFPAQPTMSGNPFYFGTGMMPGANGILFGNLSLATFAADNSVSGTRLDPIQGGTMNTVIAAAFGTPSRAVVVEAPFNSSQQVLHQVTIRPADSAEYIHGVLVYEYSLTKLVSITFATKKPNATVHLAAYADGGQASSAPLTLRWDSGPIKLETAGVHTVRCGDDGVLNTEGRVALAVRADEPDVFVDSTSVVNSSASGFNFPVANADWPAELTAAGMMLRSGGLAVYATFEDPLLLTSATMYGDALAQTPAGFLKAKTGYLRVAGNFEYIDISEDRDFARATTATAYLNSENSFPYVVRNFVDGARVPIYFRLRTPNQLPILGETSVVIDTQMPTRPGTPYPDPAYAVGYATFKWTPSTDPPGGSGFLQYLYTLTVSDGRFPINGTASTNSVSFPLAAGLTATLVVRAADRVGNWSALTPRSAPAESMWDDTPILSDVETSYQATSRNEVWWRHHGASKNRATIQMSDEPTFSAPQEGTWFPAQYIQTPNLVMVADSPWLKYDLTGLPDGLHTFYQRMKTGFRTSNSVATTVMLDRVGPRSDPPAASRAFFANGIATAVWSLPQDPEPATGLEASELEFVRNDTEMTSVLRTTVAGPIATTQTLVLPPGQPGGEMAMRLRGQDAVGNWGNWAVSDIFEVNARPNAPAIELSSGAPTSGDFVVSTAVATDPDTSDTISAYRYRFERTSPPVPRVEVAGDMLTPAQTARGETWRAFATADDNRGATGWEGSTDFTVANGRPTIPFVEIRPRAPEPGRSLIVYVNVYSTDPDGDEVGYDFHWFLSRDGGTTWIEKAELNGSSQVDGLYIANGELWRVECVPYELASVDKSNKATRVEGLAGWDLVRVGKDNSPPILDVAQPLSFPLEGGRVHVRAAWSASDPDGGPVKVDVYLTDQGARGLIPVAHAVEGHDGLYEFDIALPPGGPFFLRFVATDNRGAITQVTTEQIKAGGSTAAGWLLE